jgi:hypothetical protein
MLDPMERINPGSRDPNNSRMITPRMTNSIGPGIDNIANMVSPLQDRIVSSDPAVSPVMAVSLD